ncbi:FliH/SctL family protein [Bdellovibrio sp. HCB337]|uniref:FliH/SctL family protein n=1 Tax=Bdellovibrio sp. HCB337 TaxID=3394358 RepID=UPI0039A63DB8
MPWSRAVLPKIAAKEVVLEYVPKKFELGTPKQALDYLEAKKHGSDFRLNETIRIQTGVDELEKITEEEKTEARALELLKEVQESAYKEAYELGISEGRHEAFTKFSREIEEQLQALEGLLKSLEDAKKEVLNFNEAHLVKLVFQIANKIARVEVEKNDQSLLEVLRGAVTLAQDEENITVRVATEQHEFVEELKKQSGRQFEFLKKIKFEPSDEITKGGCIVETNYGEVDARVEQRVESLWSTLAENIPKVKPKIAV